MRILRRYQRKEEQMKTEESDYNTGKGSWLPMFILGGLIGASVGLLVAPKSGRKTREQIKDLAQDARERAEGYYEQAKGKISTAMQKGAEVFQEKKAEVESTIAKGKEAYRKAKESMTE
jgi:gas vesicle protein